MWKEKLGGFRQTNFIRDGRMTNRFILALTGITSIAAVVKPELFSVGLAVLLFFAVAVNPKLALFWLVVFAEDIFNLVNPELGLKDRLHPDLMLIILVFMFAKYMAGKLYNKNKLSDEPSGMFGLEVTLIVAMLIVGSVNSMLHYDQPVFLGLRSARYLLIYLFYFPLKELFKNPAYRKWALDFLLYFGVFATTLYLVQYVVFDSFKFMYITTYGERFGGTRLRMEVGLIISSMCIAFSRGITDKSSARYWIIAIYEVAAFAVITKIRVALLGLAIAFLVGIFIQKRYSRAISAYLLVIFIGINMFNLKDSILYKMYNLTVNEVATETGNYGVRVNEIEFYMDQVTKSPILGRGILNKLHPQSLKALGEKYEYSLSDIGILGFFFSFGIVGVAWVLLIFFKLSRLSIRALKTQDESRYSVFLFTAFLIITSATIMYLDNENTILYIIIFASIYENVVNENEKRFESA